MELITLDKIPLTKIDRIKTNIPELDELLGGGFMNGQIILLAGEPGAGKSTFLLEVANNIAEQNNKVLYSSGEENLNQIKLKADKLGISSQNIYCSDKNKLEELYKIIYKAKPKFIVVDSLQAISSTSLKQAPGSDIQTKYCLSSLIDYAKKNDKVLITVGHSTKSGLIAGLLTLQHMVDTSLFMTTGDKGIRRLIVKKNRFGQSKIEWIMNRDVPSKEDSDKLEGYKKIIVTYKDIQEMLNKNLINKLVVGGDLKWIYREKENKLLTNMDKYAIMYYIKEDE